MLDYLKKFKQLPSEVRDKISNKEAAGIISELEKKYDLDLVSTVMKVATGDIRWADLESYLINEMGLSKDKAGYLEEELNKRIFAGIRDHLQKDGSDFGGGPKKETESKEKQEQEKPDSQTDPSATESVSKEGKKPSPPRAEDLLEEGDVSAKGELPLKKKKTFLPKRKRTRKLVSGEEEKEEKSGKDEGPSSEQKKDDTSNKEKEDITSEKTSKEDENKSGVSFFSSEEEDEIKELSRKMEKFKKTKTDPSDPEEKLGRIIKEVDINFSSEATKERFKKIIFTYLKGVRNHVETKRTLAKEYDKGGLGLEEKNCDRIMKVAQKHRDSSDQGGGGEKKEEKTEKEQEKSEVPALEEVSKRSGQEEGQQEKEQPEPPKEEEREKQDSGIEKPNLDKMPGRDVEYDLASVLKQKDSEEEGKDDKKKKEEGKDRSQEDQKQQKQQIDSNKEEDKDQKKQEPESEAASQEEKEGKEKASPLKGGESKQEEKKEESDKKEKKEEPGKKERPKPRIKRNSPPDDGKKKKMEDIKKTPRLVNPINELKYMDLTMFRRLGSEAEQRTDKILEKIDALSEKYFAEKLEGIEAWRQSPVNRMYVQIGKESIVYNKSVDDIIKEKQEENGDYLNKEEFDAIMSLNNKLRFY